MLVVVQLERLGDIAQSLPALHLALREAGELTLVVHDAYSGAAARLLPGSVTIRTAAASDVIELQRALGEGNGAWRAKARALAERLEIPRAERVINLGWDPLALAASTAIAEVAGAGELHGPRMTARGERLCPGPWSSYPLTAVDVRPSGRLHVADVRRFIVAEALGLPRASAAGPAPSGDRENLAVVNVAASTDARSPQPAHLVPLLRALAKRGLRIALNGRARNEADDKALQEAAGPTAIQLADRGLDELLDVLERAALVAGPDTGPLHVGGGLGAAQLTLHVGGSHVWETGPLSRGSLAIQALPVGSPPAGAIEPGLVARAALGLLDGDERALSEEPDEAPPTSVVLVADAAPEDDPLGGVVYRRPGHALDARSLRIRRTLAAMAGIELVADRGEENGSGDELVQAARSLARLCQQALEHLAAHRTQDAVKALGRVPTEVERIAGIGARSGDLAPACLALRNQLANLPELPPHETIAAHERAARRLVAALGQSSDG